MKTLSKNKIIILLILLAVAVLLAVTRGSVNLSISELLLKENRQILNLRVARVLLAIIAGSGLGVCGVALQAIVRNPLAEPYLLGTSSGAGLGAASGIILGISGVYLPIPAFLGAIFSAYLVYSLARQHNKLPVYSLVLCGVIVSMAFSAIIVLLVSLSSTEALHGVIWWLWGSLEVYDLKLLIIVGSIVSVCVLVVFLLSQDLNAISIGEEEAIHLGINIEATKKIILLLTSLITASLICVCGIIGFVGLIIPHMMRLVVGPNIKVLLPATCLAGAAFMVVCDLLSRTLLPPVEIPIGVITSCIGAPIFIVLLKRSQRVK